MRLRWIKRDAAGETSAISPLSRAVLLTVVGVVLGAACYRPEIASGSLHCAPSGKRCPDGFECRDGNVCVRPNWDGSREKAPPMTDARPDACVMPDPVPQCQPDSNVCDPVCQTGCDCGQKCSVNGRGGVACVANTGTYPAGHTCLLSRPVESDPFDDCRPGSVCMEDCGSEMTHCYDFCKSDADCPRSACTRRTSSSNHMVCESPFVPCDPRMVAAQAACPVNQRCYLLSPQPAPAGGSRTVCACNGPAEEGKPCADSRECFQGHVCPQDGILGGGYCRRICRPSAATSCPLGSVCRPWGPVTEDWGYCF